MVAANAYFAANPDVAAAFAQNNYGLTPDQFAATHYNLYGASEQRAQPTIATSAPSVQPSSSSSLPPPPTWMDAYNKWNVEQNLPERAAKGYTTPDMWAWNTDAEHKKVKDLLDKQYLENVRQYNAIYGTDIKPDTSVLGSEAQPNQTYYTPDEGGGLFGGGGFLGTGINWTDIRNPLEAAAVVAGNYLLPGSSLLTSQLVSEGAKEQLNTDLGKIANIAAGATGGIQGNTANYGKIGEAAGITSGAAPSSAALDAQFISADASQLAAQGLSQAAIEQNLIAAGVDAFTAADAAQLALQGIKGTQLEGLLTQSSGGNPLFTTAGATTGGATSTPNTTSTSTTTNPLTSLTPAQISTLAKAGINVAGLLAGGAAVKGIANNLTNNGGGMLTQQNRSGVSSGSAQYSPEYYQAIQAKYNQMMPQQPRDVTTELKNWYETKYAPKVTP